jgi:hypothetical protein
MGDRCVNINIIDSNDVLATADFKFRVDVKAYVIYFQKKNWDEILY